MFCRPVASRPFPEGVSRCLPGLSPGNIWRHAIAHFFAPASPPTSRRSRPKGDCKAAVALHIDKGEKDGVRLDGLSFIVMLHSPGPMGQGNIAVGLIVDEAASPPQVEAIRAIATGVSRGGRWPCSHRSLAASQASSSGRSASRPTHWCIQ
ncbi:DUF1326 domain-containing protein (plasmid) [Polaromonas hydrogenivorans]|uniref:DUF1326 domain-containing protein n=1 Tax=Polaromonas hydrogenivorans TaxID=335476 RepID=A0AAU7LZ60_9BURK